MYRRIDTVIIGAGQAGLATSRCLSDLGVDHIVLERGVTAERWRSERWASLRLLTPNWMSALPGFAYSGADPDGFMHKTAVADHLDAYRDSFSSSVLDQTVVHSVARHESGYQVRTSRGTWIARAVVIATGACDTPNRAGFSEHLDKAIVQETTKTYKSPDQIADGGVLVVGASASGVQLADELSRAGRAVTLAVGSHVRVPRRYRGRDLMDWLDLCGLLDTPRARDKDIDGLLRQPSFQLVGGDDGRNIDLGTLQDSGVRIVGRALDGAGHDLRLAPSPAEAIEAAEIRQHRLLDQVDIWITSAGLPAPITNRPASITCPAAPDRLDLKAAGIKTIVWATGYRRDYSWLDVPVLTASGEIAQFGGATASAGLFTMGLPFMRHRNSTFIGGVGRDACAISAHVATHLGARCARVA